MSRICVFCCKSIPDGSGENQGKQCLQRFVTLLERYLGGGVTLAGLSGCLGGVEGLELGGCQQCLSILKSFCDAYHQMKCSELHVQWKVYTLTRVMREAGRVPSRMRFLQEACGGNGDEFRNLLKMRNNTIDTCSRGLRRCAPKVGLQRLRSSEGFSSEPTPTDLCSKSQLFLSNWTSSFAVVLILLSLSPGNPTEYHQDGSHIEADLALDDVSLSPNELQNQDVTSEEIKCPLKVTLKSETVGASEDGSEIGIAGERSENNEYETYDNDRNSNFDSAPGPDNDESTELGIRNQTVYKEELNEGGDAEAIESSHDADFGVIDNRGILDSRDFSKLAEPVPTTSGGRINTDSVTCTQCFKRFPKKLSLKLHVSKKHPEMRTINKAAPYSCELCVTGHSTYQSYLAHKRTFSHQQKFKRKSTSAKVNIIADEHPIKNEAVINETSPADNDVKTSSLETECQEGIVETKYNLRTNRRYPITSIDVESNEGVASSDDEDVASDFGSSGSSLSSSSSASSGSDNEEEIPNPTATKRKHWKKIPRGTPILRCSSATCKTYYTIHKKSHEKHMNLHKSGQYQCNFCEVIKDNAFDLSIHELKIHSDSKRPSSRIGVRVYHCPRCEYLTQFRLAYINHFAHQHLGFIRESRCQICQVKLMDCRQRSHFRKCHDITGLESHKILRCSEENCAAYFTSKWTLLRHKRQIHPEAAPLQTSEDEDNRPETKLQCPVCVKDFKRKYELTTHQHLFHKRHTTRKRTPFFGVESICSVPDCKKSFKRMEVLERHRKLHGSFKCRFCEVVKEYAPDLALHEMVRHNSMKSFKCPRCPTTYCPTRLSITEYVTHHLEAHLGLTNCFYSCSICNMRFKGSKAKGRHFLLCHRTNQTDPEAVKRCDKCPAYFLTEKQLRKHNKNFCNKATNDKQVIKPETRRYAIREQYECSISECLESFDTSKSLELHGKLHGNFKCQFCTTTKGYAFDLAKHELEHVDIDKKRNQFTCARCPLSLSNEPIYLRHFVEAHLGLNANSHSCPICSATFFTNLLVRRHTKNWHNTRDMDPSKIERCDQCPTYFIKKAQLLVHQRFIHKMEIDYKRLKCVICDKTYKTRNSLRSHERLFHGVGKSNENFDFECDLENCRKRFRTKNELDWHKIYSVYHRNRKGVHWDPREKVKCQECGKEYAGVGGLKCHMRVHRKDRPTEFKCNQCDKIFKSKLGLKEHQKFHLGPDKWDFMCAICSKKCVTKYVLKEHMRTHSNEKPFVCQLCGKKYAHRHNLRNHVNTKHKDDGVADLPKKMGRKHFVLRKGMKLTKDFCATAARDKNGDLEGNK